MKNFFFSVARPVAPALSLVCFPHAGGNASTYMAWSRHLPRHIEVTSYQAPGRGARADEPTATSLAAMVDEAIAGLTPLLARRPVALFGHSFGGLLAYEVARALRERRLPPPLRVIISGSFPASQLAQRREQWAARASDEGLFDALAAQGGVPEELLPHREVFLPMMASVRAEFDFLHDYEFRAAAPLALPLSLFAARGDRLVSAAAMAPWRELFGGEQDEVVLPGDHYYVDHEPAAVCHALVERLENTMALEQVAF